VQWGPVVGLSDKAKPPTTSDVLTGHVQVVCNSRLPTFTAGGSRSCGVQRL
jgi:hypothetical protein